MLLGNESAKADTCQSHAGTWTLSFMSEAPGSVFDRASYDVGAADYICWYYKTGDVVARSNGLLEKCGYMITGAWQ